MILGIGGIAGNLPIMSKVAEGQIEWEWWAYFGGWIALITTGLLVQFCKTAKDVDHNTRNSGREGGSLGYTKMP